MDTKLATYMFLTESEFVKYIIPLFPFQILVDFDMHFLNLSFFNLYLFFTETFVSRSLFKNKIIGKENILYKVLRCFKLYT